MMEDWGEFDTDLRAVYYEYSQTLFMETLRGATESVCINPLSINIHKQILQLISIHFL